MSQEIVDIALKFINTSIPLFIKGLGNLFCRKLQEALPKTKKDRL
jgi:hypothetical protein